jgi:group I intron endonuclease
VRQSRDQLNRRRKQAHKNKHLQSAWDKYGETAFEFIVLETVPREQLIEREQYYLDLFQSYNRNIGFNIRAIAKSQIGVTHTEEYSAEISRRNRGQVIQSERREQAIANWRGEKHTESTKRAIAQAHLGPRPTFLVIDPDGNEYIIANLKQFCLSRGINYRSLLHNAKSKYKHKGQWNCQYIRTNNLFD